MSRFPSDGVRCVRDLWGEAALTVTRDLPLSQSRYTEEAGSKDLTLSQSRYTEEAGS